MKWKQKESSLLSVAIAAIAQRGGADSTLWGFQNPIGQSPEQPSLSSMLTLLWAGDWTPEGCTEDPSSLKDSMTFFFSPQNYSTNVLNF